MLAVKLTPKNKEALIAFLDDQPPPIYWRTARALVAKGLLTSEESPALTQLGRELATLIVHVQALPEVRGHRVDVDLGVVYGRGPAPITSRNSYGYVVLAVAPDRKRRHLSAHRLVWEAVHGPIPDGMEINHINGVKDDNRIANLEMVTPGENQRHAHRTGLKRADGEHNGRYKHGRYVGKNRRTEAAR